MFFRALLSLPLIAPVAALPHAPFPQASQPGGRKMHITLSTDRVTPISMRRVKGAIILPAQIAGESVNVLFDNGSDSTLIDESFSKAHGMKVQRTGGKLNTGTSIMRAGTTDGVLVLGGAVTISGQLMTADLSGVSRALDMPVAAILGSDALKAFVVVVNPDRGWIALGLPGQIDVNSHVSTGKAAMSNAEAAKALLPKLTPAVVPFGPDFAVNAMINGAPVSLLIDYGHTGAITLRDDVWQRIIPADARTGKISMATKADGQRVGGQSGTARDLELGTISAKDVPVTSQPFRKGWRYEGLLGLGILGSTTTILQMPKRQLWIFPVGQDVSVAASASAATPKTGAP
ncbi:hypothetical protein EAH87_09285 [Sphingomonas koreensis]|nr:hypothetical protein EAH87_09285 [Sphingomonas koreensis]